jgi:glycosyltransferase involved in cell wall biosynthesis
VRNPDISIVIPSFNQGQFIERTLLSILKQEYQGKVEVIVSDGGSTDNTIDILKKYDKQITWWSEKDSGYADAVNKGFRKASGEIYAIQSSDDYYLKNAFLNIIKSFCQHPDATLICGREVLQNPDGYVFGGYILPEIISPRSFLLDHLFPGIFQHTTFFQRNFYEKVSGMRSQFDMCADADLFYRILHFGNGYFMNEYTAVYQRHDSQRTRTQVKKFESQILNMVISCKNDTYYNELYAISDEDFFLFSSFINLFYLQFTNIENAQIKAKEVINNSIFDERTKNLAQQLLKTKKFKEKKAIFESYRKFERILSHLFKKYILMNRYHSVKNQDISFRDIINADWWQNGNPDSEQFSDIRIQTIPEF